MTKVKRSSGTDIAVDESIVMWHTVLEVAHDNEVVGVSITNNPLIFDATELKAQVVMHKTRSTNCAKQVARYVRRHFEVHDMTPVVKHTRPVEARIGYACAGGYQHEPNERTPGWGLFQHIASTSIADLLRESLGQDHASKYRWQVYEVRCGTRVLRGCTNRVPSVVARWRRTPPPGFNNPVVVLVGKFDTAEEAARYTEGYELVTDALWPRFPSPEYIEMILRRDARGTLIWAADGEPAVRPYAVRSVCIGPQVYTERQILGVMEHGEWIDGRSGAQIS